IVTDAVSHNLATPISLRWDAIKPGRMSDAIFQLNAAEGWQDFRDATALWSAPAQNIVYADTSGNIGFQHAGETPNRESGNDTMPEAGSDPSAEWTGTVPAGEMPFAFNPSADRIVTANDRIVNDDFPHFISVEWMNGYRGQRIRELIDASDRHTVETQ